MDDDDSEKEKKKGPWRNISQPLSLLSLLAAIAGNLENETNRDRYKYLLSMSNEDHLLLLPRLAVK